MEIISIIQCLFIYFSKRCFLINEILFFIFHYWLLIRKCSNLFGMMFHISSNSIIQFIGKNSFSHFYLLIKHVFKQIFFSVKLRKEISQEIVDWIEEIRLFFLMYFLLIEFHDFFKVFLIHVFTSYLCFSNYLIKLYKRRNIIQFSHSHFRW